MTKECVIKFFASGFYSSYSSFIPGTTGTIPAWLLAYFVVRGNYNWVIILSIAFTIISVFLSHLAEGVWGHDAKKIVIDEWAGMFITLLFVPYSLINYLIAFIAFRGFDGLKIAPANYAERLPGGWGVTADDIVAAIYAGLSTRLAIYILEHYIMQYF